jgi:hypothetical protein
MPIACLLDVAMTAGMLLLRLAVEDLAYMDMKPEHLLVPLAGMGTEFTGAQRFVCCDLGSVLNVCDPIDRVEVTSTYSFGFYQSEGEKKVSDSRFVKSPPPAVVTPSTYQLPTQRAGREWFQQYDLLTLAATLFHLATGHTPRKLSLLQTMHGYGIGRDVIDLLNAVGPPTHGEQRPYTIGRVMSEVVRLCIRIRGPALTSGT